MPQMERSGRKLPNIALTGTPAVGKSTLARNLARRFPSLKVIDLNAIAESQGCRGEYDESMQCYEVDEDKLAEKLLETAELEMGGNIIDWMHADFWQIEEEDEDDSSSILDLVVTVRASNTSLFDRYKQRNYPTAKIDDNLDAEIMGVIAEDNELTYANLQEVDLMELQNDTGEDMEKNMQKLQHWIQEWREKQGASPLNVDDEAELKSPGNVSHAKSR